MTGTWRGTVDDAVAGAGPVALSLTQTNISANVITATGTWQVNYPAAIRTPNGVVTGFYESNDRWLIYLDPLGQPPCFSFPFPFSTHGQGFELHVTRTGNRLAGTAIYRTCTDSVHGTIDVSR